jgi:uronate dehydrogenase
MAGVETVIHLARARHATETPSRLRTRINPANVQIDANVFAVVVETGVRRLIVASSVHADDFRAPHAATPLSAPGSYHPPTPYGSCKLISEEVGKVLATRYGFEFVAARFGGVTPDNAVKSGAGQTATWLSHRDLLEAITACLTRKPVPSRATVFYVVSDNADRVHDTSNPFGWAPKDDSSRHM